MSNWHNFHLARKLTYDTCFNVFQNYLVRIDGIEFMFMTSQVSSNKGARVVRKPDKLSTGIPINIYTSVIRKLIINAVSFIIFILFILPP